MMIMMAMKSAAATPHTRIFCCISRLLMLWISRRAVFVSPPTSITYNQPSDENSAEWRGEANDREAEAKVGLALVTRPPPIFLAYPRSLYIH